MFDSLEGSPACRFVGAKIVLIMLDEMAAGWYTKPGGCSSEVQHSEGHVYKVFALCRTHSAFNVSRG